MTEDDVTSSTLPSYVMLKVTASPVGKGIVVLTKQPSRLISVVIATRYLPVVVAVTSATPPNARRGVRRRSGPDDAGNRIRMRQIWAYSFKLVNGAAIAVQ